MPKAPTRNDRFPLPLAGAAASTLPGAYLGAAAYLGLPAPHPPHVVLAVVYGVAITGAAFLLSWAAEAAQVDINAGLALALLALIAVLPEYAVDFVFTGKCGQQLSGAGGIPEVCSLALANMTGANRVLVGIGWPLVILVSGLAVRRARRRKGRERAPEHLSMDEVRLAPPMRIEVAFLGIATVYSLTLPLRTGLGLWDSAVLVAIFAGYGWRLARLSAGEPELLGTSEWLGTRRTRSRRTWVIGMFVVAGMVILLAAEHFAESLVATGETIGVSKFVLVQWVAPLASESPELLVACLYAWRLKAQDSFGTLLSSKVNQWTLLVGGLPIVLAVSGTTTMALPLDTGQRFELLITAAQSLLAVALLLDLKLSIRGASALLSLFLVQFLVSVLWSDTANRITITVLSVLYIGAAAVILVRDRHSLVRVVKDGTRTPVRELQDQSAVR